MASLNKDKEANVGQMALMLAIMGVSKDKDGVALTDEALATKIEGKTAVGNARNYGFYKIVNGIDGKETNPNKISHFA